MATQCVKLRPLRAVIAMAMVVLRESGAVVVIGGSRVQVQVQVHAGDPWLHFSARVSAATGLRRFGLANATDGAPVTRHTWELVRNGLAQEDARAAASTTGAGDSTNTVLVATPATATSPASSVDPFWACERTNVPQPSGIAANW